MLSEIRKKLVNFLRSLDQLSVTWWSVKLLSLGVGALATWEASAGRPVLVRLCYVLLIDGAWFGFWTLTDASARKELRDRLVYSFALLCMTGAVIAIAGVSGSAVDVISRVAVCLLVVRSIYSVVSDYAGYVRDNADIIMKRRADSERRREDLAVLQAEIRFDGALRKERAESRRRAVGAVRADLDRDSVEVVRRQLGLKDSGNGAGVVFPRTRESVTRVLVPGNGAAKVMEVERGSNGR